MWKKFPGAKARCMKDYVKPSVRQKPDHLILRVGTNDMDSDKLPEILAKSVVAIARLLKEKSINVSISNLIEHNDRFSEIAVEVNESLKKFCREHYISLIDHTNSIKTSHLKWSKLHLNGPGSNILGKDLPKTSMCQGTKKLPRHNKAATAKEKDHEKTKKPRQHKKAAAIKKNPRQNKNVMEKPQRNEKETHQNKKPGQNKKTEKKGKKWKSQGKTKMSRQGEKAEAKTNMTKIISHCKMKICGKIKKAIRQNKKASVCQVHY